MKKPEPKPSDPIALHDAAVRNHLAELVRALLQSGDTEKLVSLLKEHRSFIDGMLDLLHKK